MKCNLLISSALLMASGNLIASPFTVSRKSAKYEFTAGQTTGDELVLGKDSTTSSWKDSDFKIIDRNMTFSMIRGLSSKSDFKTRFTYKSIRSEGDWLGQDQNDQFQGLSEASFAYKRTMISDKPFYLAAIGSFTTPASDYDPNRFVTPGIEAPEYAVGLSVAAADVAESGLVLTADAMQAFRTGRANDQSRFQSSLIYVGFSRVVFGATYKGVRTDGGIDINMDDPNSEWNSIASQNDEGNIGLPFPRLNESYDQVGGSIIAYVSNIEIKLSYADKLTNNARNTILGSSVTLGFAVTSKSTKKSKPTGTGSSKTSN